MGLPSGSPRLRPCRLIAVAIGGTLGIIDTNDLVDCIASMSGRHIDARRCLARSHTHDGHGGPPRAYEKR